jgi:hypothetical protein
MHFNMTHFFGWMSCPKIEGEGSMLHGHHFTDIQLKKSSRGVKIIQVNAIISSQFNTMTKRWADTQVVTGVAQTSKCFQHFAVKAEKQLLKYNPVNLAPDMVIAPTQVS